MTQPQRTKRHTLWTPAQKEILKRGELQREFLKVAGCGVEGYRAKHRLCGYVVYIPFTCKSRLCPKCSRKWAAEQVEKYSSVLSSWTYPRHIVLTVGPRVSAEQVKPEIARIKKAFYRLRASKEWGGRKGFWRIEIAFSEKKGTYHVHLHALADWRWVDFHALSIRWTKLTGAKHQPEVAKIRDPEKAIREALKYVLKFSELPRAAKETVAGAILHERTFSTFGGLKVQKAKREICLCPECKMPYNWFDWDHETVSMCTAPEDYEVLEVVSREAWKQRLEWGFGKAAPP